MDLNKKKSVLRYRRWCMTCFDKDKYPKKEDLAKEICSVKVKYLIIGDEFSKKDNPHYQVYIEYENGRNFDSMKKQFPQCHFEECKGDAQHNINYCSKEDKNPLTIGYANLTNVNLSKGDLSSGIVDIMLSYNVGEFPKMYELISMYPDFGDYIIKNYSTLEKIYNDIKKDKVYFDKHPYQNIMQINDNGNMPF